MIKVIRVEIDHIKNETCRPDKENPEGRFPTITVEVSTNVPGRTQTLVGKTCGCGEGHVTYGTWRVPPEGMIFQDIEALKQYMCKNDAYATGHGIQERMAAVERVPYWEPVWSFV